MSPGGAPKVTAGDPQSLLGQHVGGHRSTLHAVDTTDVEAEVVAHVSAAQDSMAAGTALPMLDQLVEVNQRLRHPRLAAVLVELRHAAFAELDRHPGRSSWPLVLDDPWPGEIGIPTTPTAELNEERLGSALVNHGCLRVDGLIPTDEAAEIVELIDRSFTARGLLENGAPADAGAPWFVPFGPGRSRAEGFGSQAFVRAVDAPVGLETLASMFVRSGVRQAITDYFGERPAMIANKWVLRRSPTGKAGTDFHQDGAFLGDGIRTVDCWLSLSHCGPGTGRPAMDLVPRRFDVLPAGEGAAFDWSLTEETVRGAAPDAPVASPVFAPGDALFFDERLPHRTSVGLDLTTRYAVESWFVAPSSYPARHVPVVL